MEIILAIVVASAVIFFGALISMGNERQRRAIDGLREQVVQWAIQDLRIKRDHFAREIRVDDPLAWFGAIASKAIGRNIELLGVEYFDNPPALSFVSSDDASRVVFSHYAPNEMQGFMRGKRSRLSQYSDRHPLASSKIKWQTYEFSVLNCGQTFDLELTLAWKGITGKQVEQMQRVWLYLLI